MGLPYRVYSIWFVIGLFKLDELVVQVYSYSAALAGQRPSDPSYRPNSRLSNKSLGRLADLS